MIFSSLSSKNHECYILQKDYLKAKKVNTMKKTFFLLLILFSAKTAYADALLLDFNGAVSATLKKSPLKIAIGSMLPDSAVLKTGKKSSASLMYMNGELFSVKENESVSIGEKINPQQIKKGIVIQGLASAIDDIRHIKGESTLTFHSPAKMEGPQSASTQGLVLGGALFGVDGIFPTHSRIFPKQKISFTWKLEKKTKLKHPYIVLEDENKNTVFSKKLAQNQNKFILYSPLKKLKRGEKYFWHLAELKGDRLQIRGARYGFQLLSSNDEKKLNSKLQQLAGLAFSSHANALLKAQVYYQFELFHAMIDVLEPFMKQKTNLLAQNLLFLAHLRMGHSKEVEKYR